MYGDQDWFNRLTPDEMALWRSIVQERLNVRLPSFRPQGITDTEWARDILQAADTASREAYEAFRLRTQKTYTLDELLQAG